MEHQKRKVALPIYLTQWIPENPSDIVSGLRGYRLFSLIQMLNQNIYFTKVVQCTFILVL